MLPYVILEDEAYPLFPYLMRPFPRQDLNDEKRIFNYRLSRARRCVECAFGILRAKWRFLATEIDTSVSNCEKVVKAACLLHNIIIEEEGLHLNDIQDDYGGANAVQGQANMRWANWGTNVSIEIRNNFMTYFCSPEGEIPWQRNFVN